MMNRRRFLTVSAVGLGATLLPGTLNRNLPTTPTPPQPIVIDETSPRTLSIDLAQWHREGKSLHLSENDIIAGLERGDTIEVNWPADSLTSPHCQVLVDNWKGFIVYDGVKILSWDVCEEDKELRKTLHPLIYGYPVVEGEPRKDQMVPLSRTAVQKHPLWHENITPQTNLLKLLPSPPDGQRYHNIAPAPVTEDLRDIRQFQYQKESEKLAWNILNWQPDILADHPYPLSNNRFLLHLMATESSLYDKIGPHPTRHSTKQIRKETKDGIDKVSGKTGSYAGMAQMGVGKEGHLTGSITETPFTRRKRWAGLEVNGQPIDSKQDYLGDWQAQMLATLYTQLIGYEYVDDILARRKTDRNGNPASISGTFMIAHLLGPAAARSYMLRGHNKTDGNSTAASDYYNEFKGYDDLLYKPELSRAELKQIKITPEGQDMLDDIECNLALETPLNPLPSHSTRFVERLDTTTKDSSKHR